MLVLSDGNIQKSLWADYYETTLAEDGDCEKQTGKLSGKF